MTGNPKSGVARRDTVASAALSGLNRLLYGKAIAPYVQIFPAAAILTFIFIIPLASLFVISLWHNSGGELKPTALTLENYAKFFFDQHYRAIAFRSLQLAFTTSGIALLIGYPLAYVFARIDIPGKKIFLFLLLTPLFVSVVVRSFGWIVILEHNGLLNTFLLHIGIIKEPIVLLGTTAGVVIGLLNVELTFMVLPIYANLLSIPRSYEEAAQTLGANPLSTWWKVTLPLSLPGILAGWLLVFSSSISSYVQPSLLGGATYFVMPTELYSQLNNVLNWPFAAAIGFLLLAIALICVMIPMVLSRVLTGSKGEASL